MQSIELRKNIEVIQGYINYFSAIDSCLKPPPAARMYVEEINMLAYEITHETYSSFFHGSTAPRGKNDKPLADDVINDFQGPLLPNC